MMSGELLCKVIQRVEVGAIIETFLSLTAAAIDFAVVSRRAYHAVRLRRKSAEE